MTKVDKVSSVASFVSSSITFCSTYRRQLQTFALVVLLLSVASMVALVVDLPTVTTILNPSQLAHSLQHPKGPDGYILAPDIASKKPSEITETFGRKGVITSSSESVPHLSEKQLEQLNRLVTQRKRPPHVYESNKTEDECYAEQDTGIIAAVHKSAKTFCVSGGWDHSNQAPASPTQATKVSRFHTRGGISSTVLQNLMLDFVNVSVHAPIKSIANDGFHHDPRFNFNMELINCACDEYANYFQKLPGEKERIEEMMWRDLLMSVPNKKDIPGPVFCSVKRPPGRNRSRWDFVEHPTKAPDGHETMVFEDPVVLVARRDDHNPFFQLSSAYNAWIMLKALEWDTTGTRVIHLDGGYPSPYDALHREMLGPNFEIIDGAKLIGKRVHFRGDVLLAPFEFSGPVIQHVDHNESCYNSELMKTFRAQSLRMLNVTPEVERELGVTRLRPMYVTVITRQPYAGRRLQRMWRNEKEVMRNMRKDYKDLSVQFRSIDYVNLTLHEQMTTTIESDMIVSMHGAGLVNVIWTRPMTTVVEIFPKEKYRYGYQNICQHVGCDYHEFRGGEDVGGGSTPNTKNKRIPYVEWKDYFHPLFQQTYDAFKEQQAVLRGEAS